MTRTSLLLPLLALAACAGDTIISLAGYNQSCSKDDDCVVVNSGDVCGCNCGNDVINRAELTRYQAEFQDKHASCSDFGAACDCAIVTAVCEKGRCARR